MRYDCLIVSDLHLGSQVCQASLLEDFLEWAVENTRELVINGDIFDDLNFKRLSKRHYQPTTRGVSNGDSIMAMWRGTSICQGYRKGRL
mgnify:CR=1 FL=1